MQAKTLLALTFIRNVVSVLPGVTEKICFEMPAFYVGKNIFARLKEGEEELVIHTTDREKWLKLDPLTFYITPHYQNYKYMLINLALVDPQILSELLITAWKNRATKRLLKQLD
ncbi:MAG: hypothetical protein V4541_11535 [Bacteroidota bacterium]